jgi:hypothetical protein
MTWRRWCVLVSGGKRERRITQRRRGRRRVEEKRRAEKSEKTQEGRVSPKLVQIRFSGKGGKTCYFGLGSMTRTNFKDRRFRLEPSMQYFFSVVAVLSSS